MGLLGLVGLVGSVLDTAMRIIRMRRTGRRVPALPRTTVLDGQAPTRWLAVLGDSAAAGHGLTDAEDALGVRIARILHERDGRSTIVVRAATDGADTAEVARLQRPTAAGAEVIVLGVGVNDAITPQRLLADAVRDLDGLLARLRRDSPDAALVLLTCPDLSVAPGLPALVRGWVGWRCRALARAQATVARAHGIPVVAAPGRDLDPRMFGPDGFHPGAAGHAELARRVVGELGASAHGSGGATG